MGAGVGVWVLDRGQGGVTMLREGGKEMSHLDIWGEVLPAQRTQTYRPQVDLRLLCLTNKEARAAGAE